MGRVFKMRAVQLVCSAGLLVPRKFFQIEGISAFDSSGHTKEREKISSILLAGLDH